MTCVTISYHHHVHDWNTFPNKKCLEIYHKSENVLDNDLIFYVILIVFKTSNDKVHTASRNFVLFTDHIHMTTKWHYTTHMIYIKTNQINYKRAQAYGSHYSFSFFFFLLFFFCPQLKCNIKSTQKEKSNLSQ